MLQGVKMFLYVRRQYKQNDGLITVNVDVRGWKVTSSM